MADGHIPAALATPVVAAAAIREDSAMPHTHGPSVLDRLGVGVSLGCAIHCIAAGLVSALPSAALGFEAEWLELLEWPLLIAAAAIGLTSLVPSFRDHGSRVPLALFALGMGILGLSRIVPDAAEIATTVAGVTAITSAHLVNLRLCHPRVAR